MIDYRHVKDYLKTIDDQNEPAYEDIIIPRRFTRLSPL
jgi:hypothetical protein